MQAMETIRCKIWKATRAKQAALKGEYDNLQLYLQTGVDDGLYSANKQQADRYFKKIKKGKQESKIVKKKSGFYIHGERSKRSKKALRLVTEEIR